MQRSRNPAFPAQVTCKDEGICYAEDGWQGSSTPQVFQSSLIIFNVIHHKLLLAIQKRHNLREGMQRKGGEACHIAKVPGYRQGAC